MVVCKMKKYNVTVIFQCRDTKTIRHYLIPAYSADNAVEIVTDKLRGYNTYVYSVEQL